jgi:hypothetical protein
MTFDLVMIDNQTVAVCQYPLLSIIVLAVFGVIYSVYFLFLGWRITSMGSLLPCYFFCHCMCYFLA